REALDEPGAVDLLDVAVEARVCRLPHVPARVLHAVLDRAPATLRGVAPVVLRDELLLGARDERLRAAPRGGPDVVPGPGVAPGVLDQTARGDLAVVQVDPVPHGPGDVPLA